MDNFIAFFSMADPNIRYVVLGSILLMASSAVVGCFTLLRKRALVGDAVAHSVLPGICLAFILSGTKDPLMLLVGAFFTGWISLVVMDFITQKTKLKEDAAIGLILSVFFGIGILLLTAIQQGDYASQTGLDTFLFGKAASIVADDLLVFGTAGILIVALVVIFFRELTMISFDPVYAKAIGVPIRAFELLLTTITVLAVVVGIQATGVVLMAAMLITPAAAARFWTHKLHVMVILAAALGAFSGVSGAYISYIYPGMPTGPWMVMVVSVIALSSFAFAPGRGIVARMLLHRNNRRRINEENILKLFYQLGEADKSFLKPRQFEELLNRRSMDLLHLKSGLRRLKNYGYLTASGKQWEL
ncbi:MAG: metal ABC transporter permease, partial [Cytophagaceae bacterium]